MVLIESNQLTIDKNKIFFEAPIISFLEYEDMVIVVLDYKAGILNNMFAISVIDGTMKWEVVNECKEIKEPSPFVRVDYVEDDFHAWTWYGCRFILDPMTGSIIFEGCWK